MVEHEEKNLYTIISAIQSIEYKLKGLNRSLNVSLNGGVVLTNHLQ